LGKPERRRWHRYRNQRTQSLKPIKLPKEHVLMNFLFGFELSFIGKVKYFQN
jgi:hypothetical protein